MLNMLLQVPWVTILEDAFCLQITKVVAILLKKSNCSDYYFPEAEIMLIIELVKSKLATFSGQNPSTSYKKQRSVTKSNVMFKY